MTEKDKGSFKSCNKCQVCGKLITKGDNKVRNPDYVTDKGSAHWDCNINLKLTKKISVIFQTLRSYLQSFGNARN